MIRSLGAIPAAAVVLLVAACSTAPYQGQVQGVAAGFTATKQAFAASVQAERRSIMTAQLNETITRKGVITIPSSCGAVDKDKRLIETPAAAVCAPVLTIPGRGEVTMIVAEAAPRGLVVAGLLEAYGLGLVQIATAADVTELRDAVSKAGAAVGGIATALSGAPVGPAITTLANAATWVVGRYLDHQRFEELRAIVARADPTIALAATALAAEVEALQKSLVLGRGTDLRLKAIAFARLQQANTDRDKLDATAAALVEEALAVGQFAKLDPAQSYVKMRAAHAALLKALMEPEVAPEAVFTAINDLLTQADAVIAALDKLGD